MGVWFLQYWSSKLLSLGALSLVVFALPHVMPGKPLALYESWPSSTQQRERLIREYGFDQALPTQYVLWLQRLITGQWGSSRYYNRPVLDDLWKATRLTLALLGWVALAYGLGTAGLWGIQRCFPWLGPHLFCGKLLPILEALPTFFIAIVLREILIWRVGWISMASLPLFEPYFFFNPLYMLLPATILALTPLRIWYARPAEWHVQEQSLRQRWQAFRRLFHPHLEVFLLEVSLTEYVFAFPGLGSLGIEALRRRDMPLLQGFILCMGVLYLLLRCLYEPVQSRPPRSATPSARPQAPAHTVYNGLWCLFMLSVVTVSAPALLRYDPMAIHSHDQFLAPGYRYTLGTDFLGRDVLSRTVKGFRTSIPRALVLTALIGVVSWLTLGSTRGLRGLLNLLWRGVLALLRPVPCFVLAFMVFMVCEHRPRALDIALLVACLPVAARLLTGQTTFLQCAGQLAQVAGLLLLLEVVFYFLNLSTESFTPTWGSDIRYGMHYGHINIWMLLAPSCAVVWSRYSLRQLSCGLPHLRSAQPRSDTATMRQYAGEDARR